MVLGAGKLHNSDTESQLSHISLHTELFNITTLTTTTFIHTYIQHKAANLEFISVKLPTLHPGQGVYI